MSTDILARLDDATLLRQLSSLIASERASTAVILAHIAEVDLRRLYLPAAYNSMYAYCVGALRLSEGAAFRRVQSARAARRCPRLFDEIAAGRLHLTAVTMLAPHLRSANADELIDAAVARRSRSELAAWLAQRFPAEGAAALPPAQVRVVAVAVEVAPPLEALPLALPAADPAGPVPVSELREPAQTANSPTPAQVNWQSLPPSRTETSAEPRTPTTPVTPPYFVLRVALDEPTHAKLERAQALLAHSVRAGEIADVLGRALDALLAKLEARRGANAGAVPSMPRRERTNGRNIPFAIRREVWSRDRGRCTFEGPDGHRCNADRALEFDHALPAARGGDSTPENLRLRCRAHNQYEADRAFGRTFMDHKRGSAPAQEVTE